MKWIQQSVVLFRAQLRQSLYVAVFALGVLMLSSLLGLVGVWLASISMIYLQAYLFLKMTGHDLKFYEVKKIPDAKALFLLSLAMVPTNMMMGTLIGLLQGSDSVASSALLIVLFSVVCSYIYIVLFHAVGFAVLRRLGFRGALDTALKGTRKNKKSLLSLGFFLILILGICALPMGLGLAFALPVAFYSYFYSFREIYLDSADKPSDVPSF